MTHDNVNYKIESGNANDFHDNLPAMRADIENMRVIHTGEQKWFKREGKWNIKECFGFTEVIVYGEPVGGKEKEEEIKLTESMLMFLPAFCIDTLAGYQGSGRLYTGYYSVPNKTSGDALVCYSSTWGGVRAIVKDTPYPVSPTLKFDDFYTDEVLIGAVEEGEKDDWWFYDDWAELEDSESDTEFQPFTWYGYSNTDGGKDYGRYLLNSIDTLYYFGLGPSFCSGESQDFYDDWNADLIPGPPYISDAYNLCWNDGYDEGTLSPACSYCPKYTYRDTSLLLSMACGSGHLFTKVIAWKMRDKFQYTSCLMGFCLGACGGQDTFEQLFSEDYGSAQQRVKTSKYVESLPRISNDEIDRAVVTFDFGYVATTETIYEFNMPEPCETNQSNSIEYTSYTADQYGWGGAYIPNSCTVAKLKDKYFVMIVEEYYSSSNIASCSPWKAQGYGYNYAGVYSQGTYGLCTGETISDNYEVLCANINGVRVEIDRGIKDEHFYVSDSHIFNYFGTAVYMYAYSKYIDIDSRYDCMYTGYGYFMGSYDKHFQSEKYEPAGIINYYGWICPAHDANGSYDHGKLAFGQCGGYILNKETTERFKL